ncbi:peptidoglycan/xylan/chitin deacetylase (PgdA/CDA1 family) [Paenibacillus taihuensis]|uniref:Peptidoglycan/xylan/chitin deacetylase (PgdA/CDA1 family) n=1 Tax=Paenibacillus taihuensis TaxID=1156355 RepID=A0A3D9SD96_9BACL|nr:polysaccharide deacetylase family protein [Paenibacillus taihuensis]REE92858.1 peptidoglycan/xylan/chitin deacetylase (PgdA/CDA1 family) [Paenibacillus taihuensis]
MGKTRRARKAMLLLLTWIIWASGMDVVQGDGAAVSASPPPRSDHAEEGETNPGSTWQWQVSSSAPSHGAVEPSFTSGQQLKKKKRSRANGMSWVTLQRMYPGSFVIWGPRGSRRVALTFDDVPDPRFTPQVLETLARYKVRATFFVVGQRAAAHPALVQRIAREGHIIGNHSYNHAVFSRISRYAFEQQIVKADRIIRPMIGYSPKFVRPPYGEILPHQVEWLRSRGYVVVNWDTDSVDWKSLDSNSILINIKRTLQPGSIILQHAGGGEGQDLSGTINALPRLIKLLRSKGYQIVTLPELLNKPAGRKWQSR